MKTYTKTKIVTNKHDSTTGDPGHSSWNSIITTATESVGTPDVLTFTLKPEDNNLDDVFKKDVIVNCYQLMIYVYILVVDLGLHN